MGLTSLGGVAVNCKLQARASPGPILFQPRDQDSERTRAVAGRIRRGGPAGHGRRSSPGRIEADRIPEGTARWNRRRSTSGGTEAAPSNAADATDGIGGRPTAGGWTPDLRATRSEGLRKRNVSPPWILALFRANSASPADIWRGVGAVWVRSAVRREGLSRNALARDAGPIGRRRCGVGPSRRRCGARVRGAVRRRR